MAASLSGTWSSVPISLYDFVCLYINLYVIISNYSIFLRNSNLPLCNTFVKHFSSFIAKRKATHTYKNGSVYDGQFQDSKVFVQVYLLFYGS